MRAPGSSPAPGQGGRALARPGDAAAMPSGFTLLEMIVVLAILGLATALVAPAALRGIDSWRRQSEIDSLLDQIRAMPGAARSRGGAIVLSDATLASAQPPLRVAQAWHLSVPSPWQVSAAGVCEGGQVLVANEYGARTIVVAPPFCDPALQP